MRIHYKPVCCGDDVDYKPQAKHFFRQVVHRYGNRILLFLASITLILLYSIGLLTYLTEGDFTKYNYPVELTNFRGVINQLDHLHTTSHQETLLQGNNRIDYNSISQATDALQVVDVFNERVRPLKQFVDHSFTLDINPTCQKQWGLDQIKSTLFSSTNLNGSDSMGDHKITVMVIVKSAVNNYFRRRAIRESWYVNGDMDIFRFRTVFVVGKCHMNNRKPDSVSSNRSEDSWSPSDCEASINSESKLYGDIVQSSGIDSYYNNTIKTFMTYRWVTERCPSDFVLALDDDYVFEVYNFIDYLRHLAKIDSAEFFDLPEEPQQSIRTVSDYKVDTPNTQSKNASQSLETRNDSIRKLRKLSHQFLWSGYLKNFVHPLRIVYSKWYISQKEYPFNKYPPFLTGGAVLMSYKTIKYFYYSSYFTNSFKFDDVYIGIIAYKLRIAAIHSKEFMCPLDDYINSDPIYPNATNCVGVHDIEPNKLIELWTKRKSASSSKAGL